MCKGKRGVDVGTTVIIADMIMHKLPAVRHFRLSGEVLGQFTQLIVIGEDDTTPAAGDGLVPVERVADCIDSGCAEEFVVQSPGPDGR